MYSLREGASSPIGPRVHPRQLPFIYIHVRLGYTVPFTFIRRSQDGRPSDAHVVKAGGPSVACYAWAFVGGGAGFASVEVRPALSYGVSEHDKTAGGPKRGGSHEKSKGGGHVPSRDDCVMSVLRKFPPSFTYGLSAFRSRGQFGTAFTIRVVCGRSVTYQS